MHVPNSATHGRRGCSGGSRGRLGKGAAGDETASRSRNQGNAPDPRLRSPETGRAIDHAEVNRAKRRQLVLCWQVIDRLGRKAPSRLPAEQHIFSPKLVGPCRQ